MRPARTKRLVIRLSAEEHTTVVKKAAAAGLSASVLMRDHIARLRIYNHTDREEWLRAIAALRRSVATVTRASLSLKTADAASALGYLCAVHRQLADLVTRVPRHAREVFPSRNRRS
jgi:Trp operon repressor